MVIPMRRVWVNVATRIGNWKTGLRKLRKEMRTYEYEDVHVMWEMLRKNDSDTRRYPPVAMGGDNEIRRRSRTHHRKERAAVLDWALSNLCHDL